ncbi:hypothetical protein Smp_061220 [Schistosoma mansoni]|uniref:hypothetical protein n=1 Tax=Schistosoma mansoni TaxID=6183 RepID=UPI00022C85D4|nr:hypothetical protein Smp_061220 [Schistosoma mansoni]|eukprot:XP_018646200.1 hypothetical protein Smp_061220 [Schistosoma mansoni]
MKRCADPVHGLCVPGGKQLRHRCSDLSSSYRCLSGVSVLPFDIKCQILSLVEISDLMNLWEVSKEFQLMIEKYCDSSQCPQLSQFYDPHNHELHSVFSSRCTVTLYKHAGVDPQSELTLRLFLRKTFLDPNALPQMYDEISSLSSSVFNAKQFLSSDNSSLTIQYDALQNLHPAEAHSETSWTRETISYHVSPRYPSDNALLTSVSSSSSYNDNGFSSDDLLTVTQLPQLVYLF